MPTTTTTAAPPSACSARSLLDHTIGEKAFQAQVIQLALLCGWFHYHVYNARRSTPGFPDLVLAHPESGKFLMVELKREKGRVSGAQRDWLEAPRRCGVDARLWFPHDWAEIEATLTQPTHLTQPRCESDSRGESASR